MNIKPSDGHQLAVAILAIATAAIGFGIFGNDIALGDLVQTPGLARQIQWAKLTAITATTVFYFLVLVTVGRMLPTVQSQAVSWLTDQSLGSIWKW